MLAACLLAAAAQFGSSPVLQPATYASPSGDYELFVDPSQRRGAGPSQCRLIRQGQEVWAAELPFTYRDAIVDDRGVAAGYSFTLGSSSFSGEFVVTILSAMGEVLYEEREEQQFSRFMHSPSGPRVAGMFHHPGLERLTLRMKDPDVNRRVETWRTYDLREAKSLGTTEPELALEDDEHLDHCLDARVITDTPLTLAHWYRTDVPRFRSKNFGARFVLLDQDFGELWSLDLPSDYTTAPDSGDRHPLLGEVRSSGAILSLDDRRFELWLVRDEQRVTFSVEPGVSNLPPWVVTELSRRPHAVAVGESAPEEGEQEELGTLDLRLLASVRLGSSVQEEPSIRGIQEFDVSPEGVIRFVRWESGSAPVVVRVTSSGEVLSELPVVFDSSDDNPGGTSPLVLDDWDGDTLSLFTPFPGDDWLVIVTYFGDETINSCWRVSGQTGRAEPLITSAPGWVRAADASGPGIVTLDTRGESYMWGTATYRDRDGRALWTESTGSGSHEDPTKLFSPEDLALDDEGRCAVISNIRHLVQVWGSGGQFEQSLDLDELLPTDVNYPIGICADLDGGWLIHDFNAAMPIWRLSREGTVLTSFVPRFPDGSTAAELPRHLRRARDGKLWTHDASAFLRLDEEGVVDLIVGRGRDSSELTEAASLHLDHLGRILVQDERTRAVHVFDRTGRRLLVCVPEPADVEALDSYFPHYTVRDDGGFSIAMARDMELGFRTRMLEFAPTGEPQGRVEPSLESLTFQPGLGTALGLGGSNIQRVSGSGEVLTTLSRHADGQWMASPMYAIGPTGSFVVLDSLKQESFRRLSLFDATGTLERSLELPLTAKGQPVFSGEWVLLREFGAEVTLVRLADGQASRWSAHNPAEEQGGTWKFGCSPDGTELWAVAVQSLRLYRYALPEPGEAPADQEEH